jgi:hypothetical protein
VNRIGRPALAVAMAAGAIACGADGVLPSVAPLAPHVGPQGRDGQFVVECGFAHAAPDDPIVHPGHSGASHVHLFFGATDVGASTTYDQLVSGGTTCEQTADTASYWAPALLHPDRTTVAPLRSVAYYRAGPGVDPARVVAYPPGLEMIAGDSLSTVAQPTSVVAWSCGTGAERAVTPPDCSGAPSLRMLVTFPDCWDGDRLSSPDHKEHTTYSTGGECPPSHPVSVPQLQFAIDYPPVDPTGLMLASGDIRSGHADFWNGWQQEKLEREVQQCLVRDLVCGVSG